MYTDDVKHTDELISQAEDALSAMERISRLLNGCPSDEDIYEAYKLAYSGNLRKAIAKAKGEVTT